MEGMGMTEAEREELIEKMANGMFASKQYNGCFTLVDMARAALAVAVAEPVIREQCAKIAEQRVTTVGNGKDEYSLACRHIAAAIREGEK